MKFTDDDLESVVVKYKTRVNIVPGYLETILR